MFFLKIIRLKLSNVLSCVLKPGFSSGVKIYKTHRYNARIKSHYFTKVPLRRPNILKYFRRS
jgi:hypothetical protein